MAITVAMQQTVAAMYAALFNRAPEKAGLDFWCGQLDSGVSLAAMAQTMYETAPARATYPDGISNADVVKAFYLNVLGRAGDAEGLAFWEARLNTLGTKGALIAEMVANVQSYTGTDPAGVTSKALFDNKVTVGFAYAVTLGKEDVELAKSVLALVTATDTAAALSAANVGQTFTLTTGADAFIGTAGNDTFNAAVGTFQTGDVVVDNSTTDNDTLNITTATAVPAVSVAKIENINVTNTAFTGASFDAANVTNGAVRANLSQIGADGAFTVSNVGSTAKAIAGTGVTTLTATVVGSGARVDAGAATTVNVDGVSTTAVEAATVYVNGNATLVAGANNVIDTLTIEATKDAVVTLTGSALGAATDVAGAGNVTLKGASTIVAGKTITQTGAGTLAVELTTIATGDLSKVAADNFIISADATAATSLTVKTGSTVTVGAALLGTANAGAADLTITQAAAGAASNTLNLVVKANAKDVVVSNVKTVNLSSTAATTTATATTVDSLNVGTADLVITGDKNITFTTNLTANSVDGSAATGNLVVTSSTLKSAKTGAGIDSFTSSAASAITVDTGAGVDTVTLNAANLSLTANLGDGNDIVDATAAVKNLTIDGGAGADKVMLKQDDYTAATLNFTGVDQLEFLAGGTTLNSSVLSGKSYVLSVAGGTNIAAGDVVVEMDALTTDLSGLVSDGLGVTLKSTNIVGVSLGMTGSAYADVITGGSKADTIDGGKGDDAINGGEGNDSISGGAGNDTITGGAGADVISGGEGTDTFVFANGDSVATGFDKITDFKATALNADKLDLVGNTVATAITAANGIDVKGAIASNTGSETVKAAVTNGVVTLSGANASAIDTLAEWIAVVETAGVLTTGATTGTDTITAAFEFGGNTYVVQRVETTTTSDTFATQAVIELTGVVGIVGVATTAAADTILIA